MNHLAILLYFSFSRVASRGSYSGSDLFSGSDRLPFEVIYSESVLLKCS